MLTIGQFSKICQVTVKTLRHYDKIGLVEPCCTDEETGYRYYSEDQLSTLLLIQRLKRYGFSLSEIREMLPCQDQRALYLQLNSQKTKLMQSVAETSQIIEDLERHLLTFERTGTIMGYQNLYEIKLENTKDHVLLSSRQNMSTAEFGTYFGRLFETVQKEQLTPAGYMMSIYHDDAFDPEQSDVEVAMDILEADKATRIMEGCLCACTSHQGPYSTITDAYGAIVKWIEENGYEIAGPPYEIYRKNQFNQLPPSQWETDVYFPIRKKA